MPRRELQGGSQGGPPGGRKCNRYVSPEQADIEQFFEIGRRSPPMRVPPLEVFDAGPRAG
ncbi:hypothetical protein GCM10023089_34180 [Quisquiliibacterium transsilvanicum]